MDRITGLARHLNLNELMGAQFRDQVQLLLKQKAGGKKKTGPKPKKTAGPAAGPAAPAPADSSQRNPD